jgi:ATP-dependent Lon protease
VKIEEEYKFEKIEQIPALTLPGELPVVPLRDVVIFPNMIFPILIGREASMKAIFTANEGDKFVFLTTQKNPQTENPAIKDLYKYGTVAQILQVSKLPNNLYKVLFEGLYQAKIAKPVIEKDFLKAKVEIREIEYGVLDAKFKASMRHVSELFAKYVKQSSMLPQDFLTVYDSYSDPLQKYYYIASNIRIDVSAKQNLLRENKLVKMFFEIAKLLSEEIEVKEIENELDNKVQDSLQKTQRKYIIQEQIRALQLELGDEQEFPADLIPLEKAITELKMPKAVKDKAWEELEKLSKTQPMSPEYAVNRNYVEWLTQVPWKKFTKDNYSIENVRKILDEDHFGLQLPKERILEFIAVLNLSGNMKKQILCFCGPPGTGKTSLARSIARALGREYIRFSLGGIRDEAEIRGHRRTYIGAMPGKVIQSMKKAGTSNPVILLDEVDKMSMDFRGDPSSALLEVLDPEQNFSFQDHYLEVDYDLSDVLFITTANVRYDIPLPLLDRMEIIELNSYLDYEKFEIAKRHIIPKLLKSFGLENVKIEFTDDAIMTIISQYTRESGVRNLERELSSVLRKLSTKIVNDYQTKSKSKSTNALNKSSAFNTYLEKNEFLITTDDIYKFLKVPRIKPKKEETEDRIGNATGLAWTSVGGDTMSIEVSVMQGAERLTLTGQLGDVMKESAQAALGFVRTNAVKLGIKADFFKNKEIHIHVPEGAIPKDGPSAGISLTMAMISALSERKLRGDTCMTGEVTLRGKILAVGGLKEKILAAKRAGLKQIVLPKENDDEVNNFEKPITDGVKLTYVESIFEALEYVFADWKKEVTIKEKKK